MAEQRDEFEAAMARLAGDPAFARLATPVTALLLWDRDGRLLGASPAAAGLREALAPDSNGVVDPDLPALARLKVLAHGAAPRKGLRLERLRFDPRRLAPLTTCACRLVELPSGAEALATAVVGPLPALPPRSLRPQAPPAHPDPAGPRPAADAGPSPERKPPPVRAAGPRPTALDSIAELRQHGTVRFLWQADGEGRFTEVSPSLAEVVGEGGAAILGRTWDEIVGRLVDDPSGVLSELFARRETWSARTVRWRIEGTDLSVPTDIAGMPIRGRDRRFLGLRGFGHCRLDAVAEPPPASPPTRQGEAAHPRPDAPERSEAGPAHPSGRAGGEAGSPVAAGAEPPRERPDARPRRRADAGEAESEARVPSRARGAARGEARAGTEAPRRPGPATAGWFSDMHGRATAHLGEPRAIPLRPVAPEEAYADPGPSEAGLSGPDTPEQAEPAGGPSDSRLSIAERSAFREIARALGARFEGDHAGDKPPQERSREPQEPAPEPSPEPSSREASSREASSQEPSPREASPQKPPAPRPLAPLVPLRPPSPVDPHELRILDGLPIGVLVHRGDAILFANKALLELFEYDSVEALEMEGGVARLFRGRAGSLARPEADALFTLSTRHNVSIPVQARLAAIDWDGAPASLMLIRRMPDPDPAQRLRAVELDLRSREGRLRELSAILDTATDGVIVIDDAGRILSLNRSAEALFGYDQNEVAGEPMVTLLAPESHLVALDYLEGLRANGVASVLNDGREVLGRVRQGGTIPLFMTIGRVSEVPERKFCAVLRDITAFKKAETELVAAKSAAEEASAHKSDFLARVSHEVRTPLSAIIGFAEVMLEERFGPVGNERYKDYLRDIHASGSHVISLVNDLLDLAKIEAGRMELSFESVNLNDLVSACVALLQPQAARDRIVMRTSFAAKLPPVVADERSMRQIALNLVSNAIKFTDAGGQVIVSTAMTDRGEVALRVRDTGIGMTDQEVEAALEPFRQLAVARKRGGTGLGLPLTKALVEANRGTLHITSARDEGTLVEVLFPPTRVLAE